MTMNRLLPLLLALGLVACSDDTAKPTNVDEQIRVDPNNGSDAGGTDATSSSDAANEADVLIPDIESCQPGVVSGCANESSRFVCNAEGTGLEVVSCGTQNCLNGECTDMVCVPDTISCDGGESIKRCNSAGTGFELTTACPEGTVCNGGSCRPVCELGKYESSYIGCEYWTLDLDQYHDPTTNPKPDEVPHAVVVSNPNNVPVTLAFYSQVASASVNVADPTVPAKSARSFVMPRLDISETGITKNSVNIVSSLPVSMHQFSPLNNESVYSNDASLLLPVNTLGTDYYVVGWPTSPLPCLFMPCPEWQHGYVTILAVESGDTFVNVTPTATITGGQNIASFPPGVTRSFQLRRGEVLNIQAGDASLTGPNDLTGTFIRGSKKIAVFSGHEEAVIGEPNVGDGTCCADHLEQQLFPINTWDNHYVAALSPGRGIKKDHWRILAGEDGVVVTTNPPQPGANNVTLNRGQFVKFFSDQNFEVNATGKVMVGQFLVSQDQTSEGTGDPAFVLNVPTSRFRKDYVLLTPDGYNTNYVNVIRPAGVEVKLNGAVIVQAFTPVGAGQFEVASVPVNPGVQSVESAEPFGIIAFGFDNAVSYAYPGGLDLVGSSATP